MKTWQVSPKPNWDYGTDSDPTRQTWVARDEKVLQVLQLLGQQMSIYMRHIYGVKLATYIHIQAKKPSTGRNNHDC